MFFYYMITFEMTWLKDFALLDEHYDPAAFVVAVVVAVALFLGFCSVVVALKLQLRLLLLQLRLLLSQLLLLF